MNNTLILFTKNHPYYNQYKLSQVKPLSCEKTKSGHYTFKLSNNNNDYYIHSKYNPEEEATNLLKEFVVVPNEVVFVLGLGLGYHLHQLVQRYPENYFVVIEPDYSIMKTFLNYTPHDLLSNEKIIYLSSDDLNKIQTWLSFLYYIKIKKEIKLKIFKYQPLYQVFHSEYNTIETQLLQAFSHFYSNLLTEKKMTPLWKRNSEKNIKHLASSHPLKELKDKYQNQPLMIISAGYSLEKNLDFVIKNKSKMTLVSVDTALRFLLHHNIEPDYVLSLDAKYENLYDFKYLKFNDKIKLIYDIVSFPKIVELFKEKYITYTVKIIFDFFNNSRIEYYDTPIQAIIQKYHNFGGLQSGGSVSTNALDLALFTQADPIYFVGLDLKYYNYKTHCRGSYKEIYYNQRTNKLFNYETLNFQYVIQRENQIEIKGQDIYHYDYIMRKYRKWFDEALALVKNEKEIIIL